MTTTSSNLYHSCVAFSKPLVNQVKNQNLFGANPRALERVGAAYKKSIRWNPGETITISFINGTQSQHQYVHDIVMYTFFNTNDEKGTCNLNLKLDWVNLNADRGRLGANAIIRIAFNQNEGAYSYVGNENRNIPIASKTMNLGWLDEDKEGGVIKHEFGHMFGLIHEHQSPNARQVIEWNRTNMYTLFGGPPNSWDQEQVNRQVLDTVDKNSYNASAYDPQSIMHYIFDCAVFKDCKPPKGLGCDCRSSFSRKECSCVAKTIDSIQNLSPTDCQVLKQMYPFDPNDGFKEVDADGVDFTDDGEVIVNPEIIESLTEEDRKWKTTSIAMIVLFVLFFIGFIVMLLLYLFSRK